MNEKSTTVRPLSKLDVFNRRLELAGITAASDRAKIFSQLPKTVQLRLWEDLARRVREAA